MTPESILKLITDETHLLDRRKQTALARGQWQKAADVDNGIKLFDLLKTRIIEAEERAQLSATIVRDRETGELQ